MDALPSLFFKSGDLQTSIYFGGRPAVAVHMTDNSVLHLHDETVVRAGSERPLS
jgi:hypothetical protein